MGLAQAAVWVGWFSAGVSGPALFGAMGVNATYGLWAVGFGLLATIIIAFGRHVSPNAELEDVAV